MQAARTQTASLGSCEVFVYLAVEASVLKVEYILPDMGLEIDDGDDDPDTRCFAVSVADSGNVTVTATLNPSVAEGDLPSGWTLQSGTGADKLQRTVSRVDPSKTVFTFSCGGSVSPKVTTLYVYRAKLQLYADGGGISWGKINTGHSWWELLLSSETVEIVPYDLQFPFLNDYCGYWPEHPEWISLTEPEDDGQTRCGPYAGGGHTPTGTHTWQIEFDKLIDALEYSKYLALNPMTFNLFNHNCTHEACAVANEAGIGCSFSTPDGLSDWLNVQ